jgi:spermidine synthase
MAVQRRRSRSAASALEEEPVARAGVRVRRRPGWARGAADAPEPRIDSIDVSEERGVRYLHFGSRWIQGAMRLARSDALELEYTRDMMFPLLLQPAPWPARVLQIGLGAASITRFLHRYRQEARLTVVEIEPRVVAAARHHFRLPDASPRLVIEIADGAAYVARPGPAFDWIIVDGYDEHGQAGALDTRAFYAHCHARLARGGVLCANLLRRTRGVSPSVARLAAAFGGRACALPPCASGNTVAIAVTGAHPALDAGTLHGAAVGLKASTGLDLRRLAARVAAEGACGAL